MKTTILITCIGGELGPFNLNYLKNYYKGDITIIGTDADQNTPSKYFPDKFFSCPRGNDPEYVRSILNICKENSVNFVIPTSDEEAYALSAAKEQFSREGIEISCVNHSLIKILSSKSSTYEFLKNRGIAVPESYNCQTDEELKLRIEELLSSGHEVVIKPSISRGGRNVISIDETLKDSEVIGIEREAVMNLKTFMRDHLTEMNGLYPVVVQEKLLSPVYDLDMLAWEGRPLTVVARKRVVSTNPRAGHQIVLNQELISLGEKIIKELNLSWLYDCDVMFDNKGTPKVIEINPRPSGSVMICHEAGIPLFPALIDLHQGRKPILPAEILPTLVIPYKSLHKVTNAKT